MKSKLILVLAVLLLLEAVSVPAERPRSSYRRGSKKRLNKREDQHASTINRQRSDTAFSDDDQRLSY
ncbi:hypothetical protein AC249_AIPGENE2560 [Exaiptasia diaphana]|nr:hypothetical protein AC249_AIPGENE2560 [Exaiptasia diaphana]